MAIVAVGVFIVAYALIATERIHKTKVALGGAAVVLALGILDSKDAFFSRETGIDWDVIFLLLGTMVMVGVIRQTGGFEYTAIWAAKRAGGSPLRVMVLLVLITAVASALLPNVTIVLLMAPVTLLVCERLDINPMPFMIAEVLASNIGGVSTLIGDPPNIIIGIRATPVVQRLSDPPCADGDHRVDRLRGGSAAVVPWNIWRARGSCRGGHVAERT